MPSKRGMFACILMIRRYNFQKISEGESKYYIEVAKWQLKRPYSKHRMSLSNRKYKVTMTYTIYWAVIDSRTAGKNSQKLHGDTGKNPKR